MHISSYTVEEINDPTGILSGERYEFFLDIDVDEDDELYLEQGIRLRVLFYKGEDEMKILNYHFQENNNEEILEFGLEEEEEILITKFCSQHLNANEE